MFTTTADTAARESGFIKRVRAFTGAQFLQTLVGTFLTTPAPTTEAFVDTAASLGVTITPQGFAARFTATAVTYLEQILCAALQQVITANPRTTPLLARFSAVYLQDSTVIRLPDALATVWAGCGGNRDHLCAAVKGLVRLELRGGQLTGPLLLDGRAADRSACLLPRPPDRSLSIADLGFWSLADFAHAAADQRWWLSRVPPNLQVFDAADQRWSLADLLATQTDDACDLVVHVGVQQRVRARLLAQRVPAAVAERRRRRLRATAKRKGRTVSTTQLVLAGWTILVTNVPAEVLSLDEAIALYRIRWQIELLFKLWKSEGHLDETRAERPARVQCEVYAKLLALICAHWLMLVSCWSERSSSPTRLMRTIRTHGQLLVEALGGSVGDIERVLDDLVQRLRATRPMTRRKTHPNAFDALVHVTDTP
ncbi:MAG TPA: IS4 family transposase [Piscinibacter sp.]|nr:IS4 family transposase [Piscinibacter sp.]